MKKIKWLPVLFLITFGLQLFGQDSKPQREKFDPNKDPFNDLKTAVETASKENKRILLDVGGEWCIWCHRLDGFIEENIELKKFLHDNFVVVKVNFSKENKNEKFLSQYPKVPGYPHFFVLDSEGKFLHTQNTGELEKDKSYSAELLMEFFKKWVPAK